MIRVKIYPPKLFLFSWFSTRKVLLVEDKPNVVHYIGDNDRELRRIISEDKPDLLVNHSYPSFEIPGPIHVYHPLKDEAGLYRADIWTTNFGFTQRYYRKLGLQAKIHIHRTKKKTTLKLPEVNFLGLRVAASQTLGHIQRFMCWD